MKKLLITLAAAALCATFVTSCAPDEEENTTVTPADPKAKWIGSWTCQETAGANPATYTVHFVDSIGTGYNVLIENLYSSGFQTKVKGSISGSSLTIANQPLGSGGYNISGNGTMTNNTTISMSFSVTDGTNTDNVTATLTKQ